MAAVPTLLKSVVTMRLATPYGVAFLLFLCSVLYGFVDNFTKTV